MRYEFSAATGTTETTPRLACRRRAVGALLLGWALLAGPMPAAVNSRARMPEFLLRALEGGDYCPDSSVSRGQMAVFLLRTLNGPDFVPPECAGEFGDVPCSSPFADWIEALVEREITAGCGGGNYCPASPVSRAQMAVFLAKAFDLVLYGPSGTERGHSGPILPELSGGH